MVFVNVPENRKKEMFAEFYNTSCLTFEGINLEGKEKDKFKKDFEKLVRKTGFEEKDLVGYKYSGKDMNEVFNLTGSNAYPEDLCFLSVPHYYNPLVKLNVGARWFDDIVDSNNIRQRGINCDLEPDFA